MRNSFKTILIIGLCFVFVPCIQFSSFCQSTSSEDETYGTLQSEMIQQQKKRFDSGHWTAGISVNLYLELSNHWQIRGSVSSFVGKDLSADKRVSWLTSCNGELQIFFHGFGSKYGKECFNTNFIITPSMSIGSVNSKAYARPVYSIGALNAYSMYEPSEVSFSLGSNFVRSNHKRGWQQVAIGSLGIQSFQLTYSNDNTPFQIFKFKKKPILVDTYDRYYTGSLSLGFYSSRSWELTQLVLSYDRYTGFQDKSFEMAGQFLEDIVSHSDEEQLDYNVGKWSLKGGWENTYFGGICYYNGSDLQEYIHYGISRDPRHEKRNDSSYYLYNFGAFVGANKSIVK